MDKDKISEVQKKLLEMNKVIIKLDPAIRNAAFEVMVPYYFEEKSAQPPKGEENPKGGKGAASGKTVDTHDLGSFISGFDHERPKDNVMLLVAWLYSQYGAYSIQAKEMRELAGTCGLVIPNRSDNTMRQAKDKGKSLFSQHGKGWKPTVSGELYLKNTYGVKKGNKPFSKDSQ